MGGKRNLHLTIKFLGWIEEQKIEGLKKCIRDSAKGSGPIDAELGGMGVFPDEKRPRVIWIGMTKGYEKLKALADLIECKAAKLGFRKEEREFSPHLTIGRVKDRLDVASLSAFIDKNREKAFGPFRADHLSIMKSTLRRTGPIYEELDQVKL